MGEQDYTLGGRMFFTWLSVSSCKVSSYWHPILRTCHSLEATKLCYHSFVILSSFICWKTKEKLWLSAIFSSLFIEIHLPYIHLSETYEFSGF